MSGHTPGPWCLWRGPSYDGGGEDICIGAGETWLANMDHRVPRCPQIHQGHNTDECDICSIDAEKITAEQMANARLIAAAPDLLEACRSILAGSCDADQVAAAVAKAETGGAPNA